MKKALLILSGVIALASCAKVNTLDSTVNQGKEGPIGFMMEQKNMVKSETALQKAGHNNFGVFAYKSTDKVNNIMSDYLVGYHDETNAYSESGTTVGDATGVFDGKSQWMYEGLGHAEFTGTYAGERVNPGTQYASNVANQYLRYWDMAAEYTCFYAYAPYVNTDYRHQTVSYVDGQAVGTSSDTYVMTIPNGTLRHGYDNADEYEFMYAWTKVEKASYGHDVALHFKRLNAKVNIKFWEDINGYSVRIIDVDPTHSVSAVPAIKDGTSGNYGYKLGKIYTENGAKIQFYPATSAAPAVLQYAGTTTSNPLNFVAPDAAKIGDTRLTATSSPTTYYAIPKGSDDGVLANGADKITDFGTLNTDLKLTGLTFHVSYELISTTGEVITVKDATVFVPTTFTNWKENTHYTYIFKITKNSNGTTDSDVDPDPESPEVPTEPGLYPIVFDNCVVEDWNENESEHVISDELAKSYHNITLGTYSLVNGDVIVEIANGDNYLDHEVVYDAYDSAAPENGGVEVSGPDAVKVTYDATNKKVVVASGAAAGLYTVTYHCPEADVYANHPRTWTAQFIVGSAYVVNTNLDEVGTKGLAASALSISATQDGSDFTPTAAQLSIEYPVNIPDAVKNLVKISTDGSKVEVAPAAAPGTYKLVLKIDEGVGVKVAEKVFTVKNYQFALDHKTVYNQDGGNTVTATALPTVPNVASAEYTVTGGFTVSGNTIDIPNDTDEGEYTVTLTVNKDTASEVQYEAKFTVQNTYTVSLSKSTLNVTVGAANAAEYGSDFIKITSTKNGVADEISATTAAKYTVPALDADMYNIEFVPAVAESGTVGDPDYVAPVPAYIKLQVKKTVAAASYTVLYTGQITPAKTASAAFVIQK